MLMPVIRILALLALAAPGAAQAQEAAAPDLGSAVVEELEVIARPPGPALWRVSKGDSEVIILGAVSPLPHLLAWDTSRIERHLDGAKTLLIPPKPKVGLADTVGLVFGGMNRFQLPKSMPLESLLPEPLHGRFVAARVAAHEDVDRYAKWKPQIAGFMLVSDFREAAGLSSAKPVSTLTKLADARHVRVRTVADNYRLLPLAKDAAEIDMGEALACLDDAVTQVEAEAKDAQALATAWAAGDLRTVKALYAPPALQRCVEQAPAVAALIERGTEEGVDAILSALDEPGKTVAVIDLNYLLRPNGVLDRLRARGAEVGVPAER